jgi:hypothetical protein
MTTLICSHVIILTSFCHYVSNYIIKETSLIGIKIIHFYLQMSNTLITISSEKAVTEKTEN